MRIALPTDTLTDSPKALPTEIPTNPQSCTNRASVPTAYTMEEGRAVYQFSIDMLIHDCELPFDAETLFKRIGLDASDWTLMMMEIP